MQIVVWEDLVERRMKAHYRKELRPHEFQLIISHYFCVLVLLIVAIER
jgi:hypothetical protein